MRDELLRVYGVPDVNYMGQRDYSLRAWLDPQKLAALNLTAMDVVNAISQQNVQVAAGQIGQQLVPRGQQLQLTINTLGRLTESEQFVDIILKAGTEYSPSQSAPAASTGSVEQNLQAATTSLTGPPPQAVGIVRLRDVARVERRSRQYDESCTLDIQPSVAVSVYQLPGSNALDTASQVYAKMKDLKTRLPEGLDYRVVYDTTPFIEESVHEVFKALFDAVILVGIVVLVFLQDWDAMILPMIDVPVSLIGTFAIMAAMGFSLNTLTLFGLVLAIGIVVDDAIVVLENIERLIATGLDARTATIKAMEEITDQELPRSMAFDWTEIAYMQLQAGQTAILVFALAVTFVFLVLAAQYESWSLPLAVILVVPMCLFCSIAGLNLVETDVNIFTQIGFVVLVGLASKNAILIVEFAKLQQERGVDVRQAALEACRLRLRPIIMTSFAFIFGVLPLVVAHGAGAEMRRALGLAVFSGMLGVTFFGIFLTPVFFYVIRRFRPPTSAQDEKPAKVHLDP